MNWLYLALMATVLIALGMLLTKQFSTGYGIQKFEWLTPLVFLIALVFGAISLLRPEWNLALPAVVVVNVCNFFLISMAVSNGNPATVNAVLSLSTLGIVAITVLQGAHYGIKEIAAISLGIASLLVLAL
jgi:formate-dependent nitrite reductase membrane component NrfD